MRAGWFTVSCVLLATCFPYSHAHGETDVTGLWVLEIKSHSTTPKTDMVEISKVDDKYHIQPDDGEWEVAPIDDFQVKDDVITFKMGGIVSCKLKPKDNSWSGKCLKTKDHDAAESFSVILRLPDKPTGDASGDSDTSSKKSDKETENQAGQKQ